MKEYLEIGQIVGTHGVKGFIKVKPLTDDIKRFDKLKTVYISIEAEKYVKHNSSVTRCARTAEKLTEFEIEKVGYNKNMVLLKLKGIDRDRTS